VAGVLPRPRKDLLLFEPMDLRYRIEQRGKGLTGGESGENVCVRGEPVPCLDITQSQQLRRPRLPECRTAKLRDVANLGQLGTRRCVAAAQFKSPLGHEPSMYAGQPQPRPR